MRLPLAELRFPNFNEVAFSLFGFDVRWYGISYVVAFVVASALLRRLARERILRTTEEAVSDLLFMAMIGTILGGRLGYVLFYKPAFFFSHPAEIVKIWTGGLAFHGGLLGVAIAIVLFARKQRIPVLSVMDACSAAATPGILCVRLANFVNGELWGRPTDLPWAMVFPKAGPEPRHPSQLYEAFLEGVVLTVLLWSVRKRPAFRKPGRLAGTFLIGYGTMRFLVEFAREPDRFLGTVLGPFSMGQLLCTAMIILGIVAATRAAPAQSADDATP